MISDQQDTCEDLLGSDFDTSTVYSNMTPPSTIIADNDGNNDDKHTHTSSSIPCPDCTFLIRASSSGKLLSLVSGKVVLAPPGDNRNGVHWKCTERKGWLFFQNTASGCYLGHDRDRNLACDARYPKEWEKFTARLIPDGGYYLMVTHHDGMWKVGFKGGLLAKIPEGESGGPVKCGEKNGQVIIWDFVKV